VEGEKMRPSEDYVLKPFKKKHSVLADEKVVDLANAVESILRSGLDKTMNVFNS
jgi:peptidyl-tRNA hydrolase